MAWTTPKTNWATGELVSAEDMNAIGENLAALKQPATAEYITTAEIQGNTAGQFADVDSNNLNLTITTAGGDVLVHFEGVLQSVRSDLHTNNLFDFDVDGNRQGREDGLTRAYVTNTRIKQNFTRLIRNLSAGSHTFKLQWQNSRNVKIYPGAQFWVREI